MKKWILFLIPILAVASAHARPRVVCEAVDGDYENSSLKLQWFTLESVGDEGLDPFSMATAKTLRINIFGKDETLTVKSISISDGVKIDLSLDSHPEQVRAVFLTKKNPKPGKRFKALFVMTGTKIELATTSGAQWFQAESLVYQLDCREP